MKANELRIGNFVSKDGEIYEADFITIRMTENYEPIPLTEEWLIKFGFESINTHGLVTFDKGRLSIHLPCSHYKNGRTYFNSWCIIEHSVKYVHQLQNLYFALTGEELTIKE